MARKALKTQFAQLLTLFALSLPSLSGCQTGAEERGEGAIDEGASPDAPVEHADVGTITKIRGSRGVTSPDLPEGAFLGEGATVHGGQRLELPRGTRVELELASGVRLRVDEDSALTLPERLDQPLTLERGRLIALAKSSGEGPALTILAADDRLTLERGEVEVHHAGETRHFGVVQGRSMLVSDGREIPLSAGASISTPAAPTTRPEAPPDPSILAVAAPELSLRPLRDSAWADAFEDTARIAENLPQGVGSLVARRAGSRVERQSLRLSEQKVKVTISGRIARTEIEQAFSNDSSQTLEGIYQFPLPADASISDLQLLVGNTWMTGEMLEKTRARRIFRQIVDATVPRDPALLQWEQGGVFKLNIFPIPGKGERRIKIAYTQVLPEAGEQLRYRYPMGGSGATATEIGDFEFEVEVDGRSAMIDEAALAKVSTPMAELSRERRGQNLRLSMEERDYQPTHELGVDVPIAAEQRRVSAATHRDRDGQGYFMLTLRPELKLQADPRPVHYAFVLDRSHGTTPELWTAAKGMTEAMLSTLEPDDRFTVLACDTACDALDGGLRAATDANIGASVEAFIDDQVLAGASDVGHMLERAADSFGADPNTDAERVVVYLGDGVPTSGALTPDELGAMAQGEGPLAHLRVQAVALGARSDLLVLDNLTRQSGGDLIRLDARDDLERVARELRLRAQVPVARDLALDLPPGLTDVYPRSIPALRPGDSLTLVGKLAEDQSGLTGMRGDLQLRGRGPSGVVDETFQIMLDAEYSKGDMAGPGGVHAHLPRTWAQAEITHLTQTEGAAAKDRIIALSREFNVLSRWTALLVLENDRMYREFNVARKAGKKDGWTDKLAEKPKAETKTTTGQTATNKPNESRTQDATAASEAIPSAQPMPSPDAASADTKDLEKSKGDFEGGDFSGAFDGNEFGGEAFDALEPEAEPPAPPADEFSAQEEELAEDDFDDDFGDIGTGGAGKGGGGSSSSGALGPNQAPAKKEAKAKKKSSSKPSSKPGGGWSNDPFDDPWNGGGGRGGWSPPPKRPRPKMVLRDASGPSSSDRQRIAELQRLRDADPTNRKAHRDLVRRAVRSGDANAMAFAAAWATADPDHAPALLAHADALAAAGDPMALRAYASAVEVESFDKRMHQRMARALTMAGDFERACSHRRALVSIEPSNADASAELVECLVLSGRTEAARAALSQATEVARASNRSKSQSVKSNKALARAQKLIDGTLQPSSLGLHGSPDLRVELRWTAAENLDVAVIDRRGKRLSVQRPESVRVRETREGSERKEVLTLREVKGTCFIEVTRPELDDEGRVAAPVDAELSVRTATGRRTFQLRLLPGRQRVALTKWDRPRNLGGW